MGAQWFRPKSGPREGRSGTYRGSRALAISGRVLYFAMLLVITVFLISTLFETQPDDTADSDFGAEPFFRIIIEGKKDTAKVRPVTGETKMGSGEIDSSTDAARERTILTARDMMSAGALAEAVNYINGEGELSPAEQQDILELLDGPSIIEGLLASQDPIAQRVGRIFMEVDSGTEISQGEMRTDLKDMGLRRGRLRTYLGLYVRVKKHARSQMFRGAIASLEASPGIADAAVRVPSAQPEPPAARGRKVALLIGVKTYMDPLPSLRTPMADVESIGALLVEKLGFETRILNDATKDTMLEAFQALVDDLSEQDSLVIFYAGHGYILEADGQGYWLPADARTDSAQQWISNKSVSEFLKAIRAKNVLLIADSCYSGTLVSSSQSSQGVRIRLSQAELRERRAVMILSSGGEEPVQDEKGAGHSVFARQLMSAIEEMNRDILGVELYETIKARVAELVPQVPQYGGAVAADHEAGTDYFFELGS